jgi:hypothetical protein
LDLQAKVFLKITHSIYSHSQIKVGVGAYGNTPFQKINTAEVAT